MSPNLEQSLVEVIEYVKSFTVEQAPLIVKEYLAYWRILDIIGICASSLLIIASLICLFFWIRKYNQDDDTYLYFSIPSVVSGITGILWLCGASHDLLKLTYTPRLYIIEGLRSLL